MFPDQNLEAPSDEQQVWEIYAADEGGGVDEFGDDRSSLDWGRKHIGVPGRKGDGDV